MREIPLTQGKVALVDDDDYDAVNQFKWGVMKSRHTFYAVRSTTRNSNGKKQKIYMHCFLLGGPVDHENHDGLDNQRSNIRPASHQQNQWAFRTKASGTASKYRGVMWHKKAGRWYAQIKENGKKRYLGLFDSEIEAARAYNRAAVARDPVFHNLNKV